MYAKRQAMGFMWRIENGAGSWARTRGAIYADMSAPWAQEDGRALHHGAPPSHTVTWLTHNQRRAAKANAQRPTSCCIAGNQMLRITRNARAHCHAGRARTAKSH